MATPAWFDTIIQPVTISGNVELSLALGIRSLVFLTGSTTFQIFGISAVGGNQDGMVVVLTNVSNANVLYTTLHESGSASSPANRFRNRNAISYNIGISTAFGSGAGAGAATYRYYAGTLNRWVIMART